MPSARPLSRPAIRKDRSDLCCGRAASSAQALAIGTRAISSACSPVGMGSNRTSAQNPASSSKSQTPSGSATPSSHSRAVRKRPKPARPARPRQAGPAAAGAGSGSAKPPSAAASSISSRCTRSAPISVSPAFAAWVSMSVCQSPNTSSGSAPAASRASRRFSQWRRKRSRAAGFQAIMGRSVSWRFGFGASSIQSGRSSRQGPGGRAA